MGGQKKIDIFDIINHTVLIIFSLIVLLPFWNIFVISISSYKTYLDDPYHLIPWGVSLNEYKRAFMQSKELLVSLWATVKITGFGTVVSMLLTTMGGYAMSKESLPGRNFIFKIFIFTMFFGGGLVPFYVLVKKLNFADTIFALTIPMAISTFNMILMKNYFTTLPISLEEAAKIDGYNDIQILFKVVLPISKPVLAAISLFYAVGYWNDYFSAMLFISSNKLMPFQIYLRSLIIQNVTATRVGVHTGPSAYEQFKMAVIIVGIIPVLAVYPFIQKYFTKGILLGSIKQ